MFKTYFPYFDMFLADICNIFIVRLYYRSLHKNTHCPHMVESALLWLVQPESRLTFSLGDHNHLSHECVSVFFIVLNCLMKKYL